MEKASEENMASIEKILQGLYAILGDVKGNRE
jgi:hypothetical protein